MGCVLAIGIGGMYQYFVIILNIIFYIIIKNPFPTLI